MNYTDMTENMAHKLHYFSSGQLTQLKRQSTTTMNALIKMKTYGDADYRLNDNDNDVSEPVLDKKQIETLSECISILSALSSCFEVVQRNKKAEERRVEERNRLTLTANKVFIDKVLKLISDNMKTYYLDTETTGLDPNEDEILEISLIDDEGEALINCTVKPKQHKQWHEAEAIHGITPAMIFEDIDILTLDQITPELNNIIKGHRVVIYNAGYDTKFFPDQLKQAGEICCAMNQFAPIYGEWNDKYSSWKWQNLTTAAKHVGHEWTGAAHRALADTLATRSVWHYILDQNKKEEKTA